MKKSKAQYISMRRGEKIFGWGFLVFQLFLPYLVGLLNSFLSDPMTAGTLAFVQYAVSFLFVICIFSRFLKSSVGAARHDFWNCIQAAVLGAVAYFACDQLLSLVLPLLMPGYTVLLDVSVSALADSNAVLRIIGVVVLAPVIEETLYRGLVFRSIWRKSRLAAYLISVLVFAAIHTAGHIGAENVTALILCFVRCLPAGLCLAWTCSKAGNVVAPILVHAVLNAITIGIAA